MVVVQADMMDAGGQMQLFLHNTNDQYIMNYKCIICINS